MNPIIITKTYKEPIFCEKEILRYAGCKKADDEVVSLLKLCINEAREKLIYKVCYSEFPVFVKGDCCDFRFFSLHSENLAHNLTGCKSVIIFAATVGIEIDRLISKYSRISPSKALMMQAIGTERVEALCDAFCEDIKEERKVTLRPRFSAGYGDLPLDIQKNIFAVLDCSKRLGISLNDSLLMSPSKSVTAFVGVSDDKECNLKNKCNVCEKTDCAFRGAI